MGNKHAVKLRRTDLDYYRHMTTFSDKEIRSYRKRDDGICFSYFFSY